MTTPTAISPAAITALTLLRDERARTEGYAAGFSNPLDPEAIAARGRDLLAEGERLLASMSRRR